ncbi:MAG: sugar transferase [Nitrospinae bacterium]|nr:sugar transferase [Nitrospinota bacterium]
MDFVGPRALLAEEIEVKGNSKVVPLGQIPGYVARHRVRPGPTGVAQIYAPRDIPHYIQRQRFWLDLKLIALSFWITFRGTWEYRGKKF